MESPSKNEVEFTDPDADLEAAGVVDDDAEKIREICNKIKKAKDHLHDWYEEARQAFDYFAGNQWDEEDKNKLNREHRPAITFNRIPKVINAIAGLEIENRQEVVYTPREEGDALASDILTGAADWVRDNCDAEDEESQSFKDTLICGIGWTETRLDYEVDMDGAIIVERVDPLEMIWDTTSKKRNLDDGCWVAREKKYLKKVFKQLWPDVDIDALNSGMDDPKGMQPHDATLAPWYINDQSNKDQHDKDAIIVTQYQEYILEPFYRVQDSDNEIVELTVSEFNEMKEEIENRGFKYIKQYRRVYKQWFLVGNTKLEMGDCPVNMFTLRAMTGMLDRNLNYWFGMVRLMKDPQMWSNKWLSQTLHIFNSNAKGGWFAESGAFKDPRQAAQSVAQNNITYLNEGGIAMLKEKMPPPMPQGISELMQYAISSVAELVGVSLESLGQEKSDVSGVLALERKRTTITILADFFDALRRYRKEEGRVLADFIISYISDGRLIRIAGQGLGKYVPLVRQDMDFKYDLVVDDTPTSPNAKERVFSMLVSIIPMLIESGIPIPQQILNYAPLPAALIRDWQELIEAQSQDNSEQVKEEVRMQLAQLEAAKDEQEIRNKQAQEMETNTKSALNLARIEHEKALAVQDMANANHEAALAADESVRKDMEFNLKMVKELSGNAQ